MRILRSRLASMSSVLAVAVLIATLGSTACVRHQYSPPPPRISQLSQYDAPPTYSEPRWDLTTLSYAWLGQGFDFSRAGLEPVLLRVTNKSGQSAQVLVDECVGIAADGREYMVYTLDQAGALVYNSEFYRVQRETFASGAGGAILGAGLGALFGLVVGGGDAVWRGAIIGGAGGAVTGTISGAAGSQAGLERQVMLELQHFVWKNAMIPPRASQAGYLYFPRLDIRTVRVTLRFGDQLQVYELPVQPANVQPAG